MNELLSSTAEASERPKKSAEPDVAAMLAANSCSNCGTPLLGPHCHACGQSRDGMIRRFSSVLSDFLNTVFALDSRLVRTLLPLYLRPGFLTAEYFRGRRIRYVGPVQLFVFLCLTAFFALKTASDWGYSEDRVGGQLQFSESFAEAETIGEVEAARRDALAGIAELQRETGGAAAVEQVVGPLAEKIDAAAKRRIAELGGAQPASESSGGADTSGPEEAGESLTADAGNALSEGGEKPNLNLQWEGLPDFINRWLSGYERKAEDNIQRIKADPNLFKDALLSALPTSLFVLLPVFALILIILYPFQRRLYMEHLIVALHSHAFLSLSLLLLALVSVSQSAIGESRPWLHDGLGYVWLSVAWWMPLYLLLMQKRIYDQGWMLTLAKFALLGIIYLVLLVFAASIAAVRGLVNL